MPCDTQRTITTSLDASNADVLGRALVAAGFTMSLSQDARTISIMERGFQVATLRARELTATDERIITKIKKAYATEAVRTAAKKYGWTVKQDAEADQLTIVRRTL